MNPRYLRVKLRAMESRRYWRLRASGQSIGSRLTTERLAANARLADLAGLLFVGVRALGVSTLSLALPLFGLWISQSVTQLHELLPDGAPPAPEWVEGLVRWLTVDVSAGFDSAALLAPAIGVAGTFVAVYFATVMFVVSTTYKDAPRRLREQIIRQPESRWYAVFFTQGVVYTALALALPLFGRQPTHLTLVAASMSAALVVVSFGRIWTTLFVLLEPTSLFPQIQRDLDRWVHRAYKLGTREFASTVGVLRANEKTRHNLGTLNDLVTLILDREHERAGDRGIAVSHDPRVALAIGSLRDSWGGYARRKHAIRALSGWNPGRTQSKDWFLTSHAEVSVALATGTTLLGSEVADDLWFERRLADFIERLLAGRELRSVESAIAGLPPFTRLLGSLGQFEELRLWLTATTFAPMSVVSTYAKEAWNAVDTAEASEPSGARHSREQHLALRGEASAHNLVDFVLLETLSTCLGYVDYFERMLAGLPRVGTTVMDRRQRLAAGRLVLQLVASLRKAISTEERLEGHRVTPDGAVQQLIARALATETVDELEQLVSYLEREIWPWVIDVGAAKSWAAGAALSRATELTEKFSTALGRARALLHSCEGVHPDRDERWPDTDTAEFERRSQRLGDRLELPVARLAATVDSAADSDRPDHFGWAYYRAHENLVRRVLGRDRGDPEELRQKVALLYVTGDVATKRLLATVRRHDQSIINAYVAEPYVRFIQLSGIALVVSEVTDQPDLFAPFGGVWKGLLSDATRATHVLGRAAATLASESAVFAITPGGLERSNVEIRANQALEEMGVPRDRFDIVGYLDPSGASEKGFAFSQSASRLLRSVRSSNFEGMFYARWLRPQALASGAIAPTEAEQFLRIPELEEEDGRDD